jgi:hypothetical protein
MNMTFTFSKTGLPPTVVMRFRTTPQNAWPGAGGKFPNFPEASHAAPQSLLFPSGWRGFDLCVLFQEEPLL